MDVEVTTPDEFMGDVIGDLNSRRGQIQGMEMRAGRAGRQGVRAAGADVRLCDRPALGNPGPRDVLDAVRSLRAGADGHRAGDDRQGAARLSASRRSFRRSIADQVTDSRRYSD